MVTKLLMNQTALDGLTEVPIEVIIELISQGKSAEILFAEYPFPHPNVITLICGEVYSTDIREVKPVISTHSPTQILIRSQDKSKVVTSWREFFIHSANIYMALIVDHTSNQIEVEKKVDESYSNVDYSQIGKLIHMDVDNG